MPQIVARTVDQMVMTWLLTLVCSAHCFNNPYLVAKLVEVLFMMNPSVQVYEFLLLTISLLFLFL
jgi:ubiquitin conjugation factor E4 B